MAFHCTFEPFLWHFLRFVQPDCTVKSFPILPCYLDKLGRLAPAKFSSLQYCLARTSPQEFPQLDKPYVLFLVLGFLPGQNFVNLAKDEWARRRLIYRVSIRPRLIHKLVKSRKVARSWCTDKTGIDQFLVESLADLYDLTFLSWLQDSLFSRQRAK